jgi:NAD-dependent deacetylase
MINVVVLSGAGISAESGLKTFRNSDGLWENYRIEDVATPMAFSKNPKLVLDFYNMRRKQVLEAKPNAAHIALSEYDGNMTKSGEVLSIQIITQNIDDLHERAGSKNVLHLHGEILKARSSKYPHLIYDWHKDITLDDRCEMGYQLRPHIVWFYEDVPMLPQAAALVNKADIVIIVGTSMVVYPAAHLIYERRPHTPVYVVDPNLPEISGIHPLYTYSEPATTGIQKVMQHIIENN